MRIAEAPILPGIRLIGWLWIITGGLTILGGLAGVFGYAWMHSLGGPPVTTGDALPQLQLMTLMYDYFWIVLAVQLVVAAGSVWAGIGLLKLRAWARTTIEFLSWLSVAYVLGFAGYWLLTWGELATLMPADMGTIDPESLRVFGWIMGAVLTAIFVVPLLLMIRYLRRPAVRAACARAATARSRIPF